MSGQAQHSPEPPQPEIQQPETRSPETRNKETAIAFYDLMFNQADPRRAVEAYVGADYIQHNPHVRDGKAGFIDYFERMAREFPEKKVIIKRAVAEEDLVVLHCHQIWPGSDDFAGMDIFRFDAGGKIVEHWDVLQVITGLSAHENGLF